MEEYSVYKYFKGEKTNPFAYGERNDAAMFWGYEQLFEAKFTRDDFSFDAWLMPTMTEATKSGLKAALATKPIDKEGLFKVWLYNLLMEYLPDKHMSDNDNRYNNLYWSIP